MKLLLDIGNSRLKWAILEAQGLGAQQSQAYQASTPQTLCPLSWADLTPAAVWVANVAGHTVATTIQQHCQRQWGLTPTFIHSSAEAGGVRNGYQTPQRLGVDRWAALIGGAHYCAGPLCVVDCGTAVTLDILDAQRQHLGGFIMPGLRTQRHSLYQATDALPNLAATGATLPDPGVGLHWGQNTQTGVMLGTLYAVAGFIEKVMREAAAQMDGELSCLLTGGDARVVQAVLNGPCQPVPDLVLRGLAVIAGEKA